ncbi:MAG: Ig-like domain-containing protein [Lachnospiraceae bacterium]|nr:Ig-like domain-containing protein [Lachnospiraceae bacterium]
MKKQKLFKPLCSVTLAAVMAFMSPLAALASVEDGSIEETVEEEIVVSDETEFQDNSACENDTEMIVTKDEESQSDSEILENELGSVEPGDAQKVLVESFGVLGEFLKTGGNPLEITGVAVELLPRILGIDDKPDSEEVLLKLNEVIKNQEKMIQQLREINSNVIKSDLVSDIRDFYSKFGDGQIKTHYETLYGVSHDENMTNEEKLKEINTLLIYTVPVSSEGNIPSSGLCKFDLDIMTLGSYFTNSTPTTEGYEGNIFGVYKRWCQYNYHWEHQSYDDLISFRNTAYMQYMMGATIDAMSLTARINERARLGLTSQELINRRSDIVSQMKTVKKNFDSTAVIKLSDSIRHYWYAGGDKTECYLFTQAHEQKVPTDRKGGISADGVTRKLPYDRARRIQGLTWTRSKYDDCYVPVGANEGFWKKYTRYKSGKKTFACPKADWFQKVYREDYGSNKLMYNILFDKDEGGLIPPEGATNWWDFMVEPEGQLEYVKYDTRADRINTPLIDRNTNSYANGKNGKGVDIYMYHMFSNEIDTDYIKHGYRVIGIGLLDKDPSPRAELSDAEVEELNRRCKAVWEEVKANGIVSVYSIGAASSDEEYKEWLKGNSKGLECSYKTDKEGISPGYPVKVSVNGEELSDEDYEEYSDGNIITVMLYPEYLENLPVGEYSVTAEFDNGMSGYEDEPAPIVTTGFAIKQDNLTIYGKKDGKYVNCNPTDLNVGDELTVVARNTSGAEESVSWSSSNENAVTVDASGHVTAHAAGDVIITARGEKTDDIATLALKVLSVPNSVKIQPAINSLAAGEQATLTVADDPAGSTAGFIWTVLGTDGNDPTVGISVSEDSRSAVITGMKEGTSKIRVVVNGKNDIYDEMTVNVTPSNSKDFTISGKNGARAVAAGKTLNMVVNWTNGKPKNSKVTWKVRNFRGAATISKSGALKGLSAGSVTVEAVSEADPSKMATADIEVYVPIKKVSLNTTKGTVSKADTANGLELSTTITPAEATGVNAGEAPKVTYSVDPQYSSDIEVSDTGVVTPKSTATPKKNIPVNVTVEAYGGYKKTLTCKVNVVDSNPLKSLKMSKSSMALRVGDKTKLDAILNPLNPDGDKGVTWASDKPDTVTVDENGNITALKTGDAVITATTNQSVTKGKKTEPLVVKCKVKVKAAITLSITTKDDTELAVGKKLSIKTKWPNGKPANSKIRWSVSNIEGKATVDQKGALTGVSAGRVAVKAVSEADPSVVAVVFINITAAQ